jgi:hypothetical protein
MCICGPLTCAGADSPLMRFDARVATKSSGGTERDLLLLLARGTRGAFGGFSCCAAASTPSSSIRCLFAAILAALWASYSFTGSVGKVFSIPGGVQTAVCKEAVLGATDLQ